jgi:hypothetical protein
MSYLNAIAAEIRSEVPSDSLPPEDADVLFLMYAVLLLAKGTDVSRDDVHNAWTAWMTSRGETSHPSMVPFAELPAATQAEDPSSCKRFGRLPHAEADNR